jgi:hypothetical protein
MVGDDAAAYPNDREEFSAAIVELIALVHQMIALSVDELKHKKIAANT